MMKKDKNNQNINNIPKYLWGNYFKKPIKWLAHLINNYGNSKHPFITTGTSYAYAIGDEKRRHPELTELQIREIVNSRIKQNRKKLGLPTDNNITPSLAAAGLALGSVYYPWLAVPDIIFDTAASIDEPSTSNNIHTIADFPETVAKFTPSKIDDYVAKGVLTLGNIDDAVSTSGRNMFSNFDKKSGKINNTTDKTSVRESTNIKYRKNGGYIRKMQTAAGGPIYWLRKRLYNNIEPFGYNDVGSRLIDAIVLNKNEHDNFKGNYSDPEKVPAIYQTVNDLWREYLHIPEEEGMYSNGKYKIKNNGNGTFSLPFESMEDIMQTVNSNNPLLWGLRGKLGNSVVGEYDVHRGYDKNGDYLKYIDHWRINPYDVKDGKDYGLDNNSLLKWYFKGKDDASFGLGTPVEIQGKYYLDDIYNVKGKDRGGHYLPEIIVTGKKKQGGKMDIIKLFKEGGKVRKMLTASGGPLFPWLLNNEWVDNWKFRTTPASRSRILSGKGVETDKQYTERRKKETTKRTWRSDAADIAHGIGEGVLALHPYTAIPYFGAKVGLDFLNGTYGWHTALNASVPLFHLAPQAVGLREATNVALEDVANAGILNNGIKTLWNNGKLILKDIPRKAENFYRAVNKDAINDAKKYGIIRGRESRVGDNYPFFGRSSEPYHDTKYVIEGTPESADWISTYKYVYSKNPEIVKLSKIPDRDYSKAYDTIIGSPESNGFLRIGAYDNEFLEGYEALPMTNGQLNVSPSSNFAYWKKYPIIGWRKYNFKQGGKMIRKMQTAAGGPIKLYDTLWVDNWRNRLTSPVVVAKQLEKLTSKIPIKYLGGSKDNARKEFWKQEPVLQHAVDSVASLYRINPESLKYRLDKEGFTDRLIQRRNDRIKIGALRFEPRGYELLNNPNYGLDGTQIGLDDAKTYIDSGKVKLINENWDERGPFKNEKGRMTYPVNPVTLNDGMGIVAAHLKYFRDEALLDFPNGSEYDLDRYANAYYNRGTYGGKKWVLAGAKGYNYRKKGGMLEFLKNGSGIHIKEKNKGKFTSYCGGKVTDECILKGKNSSNPAIRKRATFAANARKWKHKEGGIIKAEEGTKTNWISKIGEGINKGVNSKAGLYIAQGLLLGLGSIFGGNNSSNISNAAKGYMEMQELWLDENELRRLNSLLNSNIDPENPNAVEGVPKQVLYGKIYDIEQRNLKRKLKLEKEEMESLLNTLKSNLYLDMFSTALGMISNNSSSNKDTSSSNKNASLNTSTTSNSYFDNYFNSKYKKFGTFNPDGSMNMLGGTFTIKDGYKPNQPQLFNYQPPKLNV